MKICSSFLRLISSLWLVILPIFLFGQINTKIDTSHIKIGEPIHYTLSVLQKGNTKIILPEPKDTLSSHIEILNSSTDTVKEGNDRRLVRKLTITSYDVGDFLIRSLPVVIDHDTILSHSFKIQVDNVKIDSANLEGFPIKPIMEESYTWKDYLRKYWLGFLIILFTIVALITVWRWMRHRELREIKVQQLKNPYDEAMEALKKLDEKKYISKAFVKPFYSDLSFILRRYLGRVFNFSSLGLLSDDLVEYLRNSCEIENEEIKKLKEFLFYSDLVKYAKAIPEAHQHELYRKWVEDLIEKTKPIENEEEIQNAKPQNKEQ